MKKIFYTFTAATLCLTACQKELSEVQPVNPANQEVATVTVPFTVTIPGSLDAPTRGDHDIADAPVLKNLYIAVFGEDGGMLQQFVPAKKGDNNSAIGYANRSLYTAELPLYDDECHLHFIGNYEGDISELTFEYEKDFIEKLTTVIETESYGDNNEYKRITSAPGAYWQKVILPNGIQSEVKDGKVVIADATKRQLNPIALVRNYAKITVNASADAYFTVESYALINFPYQGTLAPYHPTTGYNNHYQEIGKYCDGTYEPNNNTATNYHNFVTDLLNSNYIGYMGSNDLIFTGNPGSAGIKNVTDSDNGMYMYERTVPTRAGEQTGVLVKLNWKDNIPDDNENHLLAGHTYWYKIEVLDSKGEYMPICRNVHYNIVLSELTGAGSETFDGAFNGPFFGNVSSSIETATLTTINDNKHQITVNRMDYFSVQGQDVVDLYFQFWLDMVNGDPLTNPRNYHVEKMTVSGYDQAIQTIGAVELVNDSSDPYNGWMHVKVTLKAKDSEGKTLRGKVRIQGQNDQGMGSLFRDVVFTVMEIQDFTSETTIETSLLDENKVTVNIGIPTDLPYTMFPLQIKIESQYNNLTTNSADLPVGYGASAFSGKNNTFYFIKTIQYKDYVNTSTGVYQFTTQYPCEFTKLDSQPISVKLNEMNGYFHEKTL